MTLCSWKDQDDIKDVWFASIQEKVKKKLMDNTRIRLLEEMKSQIIVLLIERHNLVEVFIYLIS